MTPSWRTARPTGRSGPILAILRIAGSRANDVPASDRPLAGRVRRKKDVPMHVPPISNGLPRPQGLYHPRHEHDSCGVNFVCDLHGRASHDIVAKGIGALCAMEHRGAQGADINTGDGAGILIQIPDRFYRDLIAFDLPPMGSYATGIAFIAQGADVRDEIAKIATQEGLVVLGWREVPINSSSLGKTALSVMPDFHQLR